MQNQLESIGLLSWMSEGTEEEFLQYARYGKLKELASLLMVAHKKLTGPMQTVLNTIPSLQIDVKKKQKILLLLEAFQRAGDAIEAYVKQEKIGVSVDQSVNTVKCLLQEAGFPLKHEDTDLNCFQWYHHMGLTNLTECRWKSKDIHMPHHGKSDYRWMVHNKSSEVCRVVGIEVSVIVDASEAQEFSELAIKPLRSLPYDSPALTFVAFEKPEGVTAVGKFLNTLRFIVKEVDPSTGEAEDDGVEHEYQLEDLEVVAADYILKVGVSNFRNAWESMDPESERVDEYGLGPRETWQKLRVL